MRIQRSITRAIAGTAVLVFLIVLAATSQQDRLPQSANTLENCKAAMPVIMKQYTNARYAVEAARNSGDRGHILSAVNQAKAALDTMEEPLNLCSDVVQNSNSKGGQPRQ